MNYPDSAQAVASSQFNKHFLSAHYQQCKPVGDSDFASKGEGGNLVIRQISAAQQEPFFNVGAPQGTGTGMVVGTLPFSSREPFAPHPPPPHPPSPCLDLPMGPPPPLPSSLLLPWLVLSGLPSFPRFSGEYPDRPQDFHCQREALTMRSQPGLPRWFSLHPPQLFRKREEGLRRFPSVLLTHEGPE